VKEPTSPKPSDTDLSKMDVEFIRVLEDLIDALLEKGVLRLTDLPPEALEKLDRRKDVRKRLRGSLDLLEDDDGIL